MDREGEGEDGAASGCVVDRDGAAVRTSDGADDGQAETEAFVVAGAWPRVNRSKMDSFSTSFTPDPVSRTHSSMPC